MGERGPTASEKTYDAELHARLLAHTKSDDATASSVARAIGKSPSLISQYINRQYAGDVTYVEDLLRDYFARRDEDQTIERPEIAIEQTRNLRKGRLFLGRVHSLRTIGVLLGPAGAGKSVVCRYYADQFPTTILMDTNATWSALTLFQKLCLAVNVESGGRHSQLFDRLETKLRGSGRLIIIDEAENLPEKALDLLRKIIDRTGIALALVGLERLEGNIYGKPQLKYLKTRIANKCELGGWTIEDTVKVLEAVTSKFLKPDAVNNGLGTLFHELSEANGRSLEKLILQSTILAQQKKTIVDETILRQAARLIS